MKKSILLTIIAGILIMSCKEDEGPAASELTISISNLAASASNEQYEGWVIVDGSPVSTGTFTADDNGVLSQTSFSMDAVMLEAATTFVLSIEPIPDNDPAPSNIKILGGDFSGSQASVSVSHGAALGADFSSSAGTAILATPTTSDQTDELSGIWFLDLSSGSPATGLVLPTLPSAWKYEGWAVINGTPVSSGTFSVVDAIDDADPFSGSVMGPPFPGEDFVVNAPEGLTFPTDLSGQTLVISIEPSPDNSTMPFAFKPLVVSIPSAAADHLNYGMTYQANTFPSGTVTK